MEVKETKSTCEFNYVLYSVSITSFFTWFKLTITHFIFIYGRTFAPTILLDVPEDSLIMNEEIFGPLLPIIMVKPNCNHFFSIHLPEKTVYCKDIKF